MERNGTIEQTTLNEEEVQTNENKKRSSRVQRAPLKFTHQRNQNEAKQQNLWNEKQNRNRNLERKTMLEATQLAQIIHDMDLLNIKILGLCETRWPGNGEITNRNGSVLLYSGKEESEKRMGGVSILLSRKARMSMLQWNPISDRIITVRMKTSLHQSGKLQLYSVTHLQM